MRERVFGIETEYALIYRGGRAEFERPTNLQLYALFERALERRVGSLPRALSLLRAKSGRFLANGMSFHYEATPEAYEHGLLEVASPECRDPRTLLHYERAKDVLVEELAGEVNRELREAGFRGEVRVGKNNVDSRGHTFGSHENYWVEDPLPGSRRLALVALWLPLWALTLPVLAWIVALTPALLAFSILATLAYAALALLVAAGVVVLRGLHRTWGRRAQRGIPVERAERAEGLAEPRPRARLVGLDRLEHERRGADPEPLGELAQIGVGDHEVETPPPGEHLPGPEERVADLVDGPSIARGEDARERTQEGRSLGQTQQGPAVEGHGAGPGEQRACDQEGGELPLDASEGEAAQQLGVQLEQRH